MKLRNTTRAVKLGVTCLALLTFMVRQRWPEAVRLDSTSFALLAIAAVPWLFHLIDTLELPGGTKIHLRELLEAAEQLPLDDGGAEASERVGEPDAQPRTEGMVEMWPRWLPGLTDPNLSLVGLRIEIEKRVRRLAEILGLSSTARRSLPALVSELEASDVLTGDEAAGLRRMIDAGNRAAHGAEVDANANAFLVGGAPRILAWLDTLIDDAL